MKEIFNVILRGDSSKQMVGKGKHVSKREEDA